MNASSRLVSALLVLAMACISAVSQSTVSTQVAQDCAELKGTVDRMQARLRDWPELNRYRDANTKTVPPTRAEMRVVFMGDSITDLWSRDAGGFFAGRPYINRGISGQTTPQMLIRFRPDVIALQPKVVVILAGTNDLAGNTGPMTLAMTEDNLTTMAELARAHGIRVVFASLLPVSDYGHNREGKPIRQTERRPPSQIKSLNEWIKRYAGENGSVYLDYFSAMVDESGMLKKELSDDGLHPNAAGYAVMKQLAEHAIAAALKSKH
ncbi:MAG TPA: SGNH/GDSL hydrolase family protein [Blastocatellia bacterium]|nr:SGNH/GDSL hydrolase family protein [Blastocatellia bacterium]